MKTPPGTRARRSAERFARDQKTFAKKLIDRQAVIHACVRQRRRRGIVIATANVAVAIAVAWGTAQIAEGNLRTQMDWQLAVFGRFAHVIITRAVATDDAWLFALLLQSVPVVLALISVALSMPWRTSEGSFDGGPMWVGAILAPGLAINLLVGFAADAAGRDPDSFWPATAATAPQGLPLIGGLLVLGALAQVDRLRKRDGGRRPRKARRRAA